MENLLVPLPVIPESRQDDLHGLEYLDDAQLILFVAGNQFMVMDELIGAFKKQYPEIEKIFYETLPPGLELKQILAGGAKFKDKIIPGRPDVYASVCREAMEKLSEQGLISIDDSFIYLHNRIVLMVHKDNPKGIKEVGDLGRDDVRISQPNPQYEDIANYIINMYRQAGGDEFVNRIMEEKRAEATTIFTIVHHRETPLRLLKKTCDVGPVWATEVLEAERKGLDLMGIEPGEQLDQRNEVNYFIAPLKTSKNPENAQKFLEFIRSDTAKEIYKKYGFLPD